MSTEPPYFSTKVVSTRRFWIPDGELDPGLGVLSGGFEHVAPDYRIERDGFPSPLIEMVAGGEGVLDLAGRTYRLIPGTLFAYGPGVPVRVATDPRAVLRKYFLTISGRQAAALLATAHLSPGSVAVVADPCRSSTSWNRRSAGVKATQPTAAGHAPPSSNTSPCAWPTRPCHPTTAIRWP